MTTPAVAVNQVSTRPANKVFWTTSAAGIDSSKTTSLYAYTKFKWFVKNRPASGNTVPSGGFRPCRAWSHSGSRYFYPPNTVTTMTYSGSTKVWNRYENGCFWNINIPSLPAFPSTLQNRAEVNALTKLKDQDFHLGQFLGEFEQTERMIANRIRTIANQVRRYRRGNPAGVWERIKRYHKGGCGRRYARWIPRGWLELQYGWRPLLSDIWGAINHLMKEGRDPLISVKGYAQEEDEMIQNISGLLGASCTLRYRVQHKCWVRLYYRLNNAGLAEVSSLGLLNPLEVIWELVPYSFVVDWVLPIGPWLGSLTADAGFSFVGGSVSRMTKNPSGGSVLRFNMGNTPPGKTTGDPPVMEGEAFSFTRGCYPNSPVPGLYIKNPLSAEHIANATALLVQAFR